MPGPLAEFVVMAMLMHYKGLLRMMRDQQRKHWERYAGTDWRGAPWRWWVWDGLAQR